MTSAGAACVLLALFTASSSAQQSPRRVAPVLAFPEPGLDDPAAYQGYTTRFFRDARRNTLQIYIDGRSGRVVHLWADAENESLGFTVRDASGRPAPLRWGADSAAISANGASRSLEYELRSDGSTLNIGWFLLGSMRVERDLQYAGTHRKPYGAPFQLQELGQLVTDIEHLDPVERARQIALLRAKSMAALRQRLTPRLELVRLDTAVVVRVSQPSFDDRSHLALELKVNPRVATARVTPSGVSLRAIRKGPLRFSVRVQTDAAALTPIDRDRIFNAEFLRFLDRAKTDSAAGDAAAQRYRWMERQVRGVELLSSREKLMAGLPNFATYFGRDMMMTALMMTPIWSGTMSESVVASVLRKLGSQGDVSHEEALGGQAIRESASQHHALIVKAGEHSARGERAQADSVLALARAVLRSVRVVRENYNMRDDELQLPVVVARYLRDSTVSAERKRTFFLDSADGGGSHLARLLRELELVARLTEPYVREPVATNLVSFPRRDETTWMSASWRDSDAGYAGGRFAMDINVVWVPQALRSIAEILQALRSLGLTYGDSVATATPGPLILRYLMDTSALARAREAWSGTAKHFLVRLDSAQVRAQVQAKLASLPEVEQRHWNEVLSATGADRAPLEFLAISLDGDGQPIPVANTDLATGLFLAGVLDGSLRAEDVLRDVDLFTRAYPVGLFVREVGPVVANDAYASPHIWERFAGDLYHSPRVVWGREVNLICLGLAKQIADAYDGEGRLRDPASAGYVRRLRDALQRTLAAVDASGLAHNELWSYRIEADRVLPIRYGSSSDVQLWNTTNLAVQFALSRLPPP